MVPQRSLICLTRVSNKNYQILLNLKSLNYLNLSHCTFIGSIPTLLRNLTQITYVKSGFALEGTRTLTCPKLATKLVMYQSSVLSTV